MRWHIHGIIIIIVRRPHRARNIILLIRKTFVVLISVKRALNLANKGTANTCNYIIKTGVTGFVLHSCIRPLPVFFCFVWHTSYYTHNIVAAQKKNKQTNTLKLFLLTTPCNDIDVAEMLRSLHHFAGEVDSAALTIMQSV